MRHQISAAAIIALVGFTINCSAQRPPVDGPQTYGKVSEIGKLSEARASHTATLLRDGRALIVGGYGRGTREAGPISTNRAWIFVL